MTRAELRDIDSIDLPNMEHAAPADPESFCIPVRAYVGPIGEAGEESFDMLVCTPRWLSEHPDVSGYLFPRHYLIVWRYDYRLIRQAIEDLCSSAGEASWQVVAAHLGQYAYWEFEGYTE